MAASFVCASDEQRMRMLLQTDVDDQDVDLIPNSLLECSSCDKIKSSSNWNVLDPKVSTEANTTVYKFELYPPGRYECKVSGLRWVSRRYFSLQYSFTSWGPYKAIMKDQYTPGGPLLDIEVTEGELKEVHLPHFACFGQDPSSTETVRVLHDDEDEETVEEVSKVTRFHAKITNPSFSVMGVLLKLGVPWKVHCNMPLYGARRAGSLTLHTYLIPCDAALAQAADTMEKHLRSTRILKPRPVKSYWMNSLFSLRTSCPSAVSPAEMKLEYVYPPNFAEVYMEEADCDFTMELISKNKGESVWAPTIRQAEHIDYFTSGPIATLAPHFVDFHRSALIQRVGQVSPILDELLAGGVINEEQYSEVRAERTNQDKMRALFEGPLRASGAKAKDMLLVILEEKDPFLIRELRGEIKGRGQPHA